jgi:hypothetical protein
MTPWYPDAKRQRGDNDNDEGRTTLNSGFSLWVLRVYPETTRIYIYNGARGCADTE